MVDRPDLEGRVAILGVHAKRVKLGEERNFSEQTAREIDAKVRAIIEEEHKRSLTLLGERRGGLTRIAERLLERETLERAELEAIVRTSEDVRKDASAAVHS